MYAIFANAVTALLSSYLSKILIATFSPVFLLIALFTMANEPLYNYSIKLMSILIYFILSVPAKFIFKLIGVKYTFPFMISRHFNSNLLLV
jgi:hypothetical protein